MKLSSITPDKSGLICGFLFSPDAAGKALEAHEAMAWLNQPPNNNQEFIWLHFNLVPANTEK